MFGKESAVITLLSRRTVCKHGWRFSRTGWSGRGCTPTTTGIGGGSATFTNGWSGSEVEVAKLWSDVSWVTKFSSLLAKGKKLSMSDQLCSEADEGAEDDEQFSESRRPGMRGEVELRLGLDRL